jgi:putative ABC transport system ATP-binding protein
VPDSPRIALRSLTKSFRSGERNLEVLRGVDLEVGAGESVAVLGPSGSGKSTLLALVAGLDRPTAGEVLLDGEPVHRLSEDELALLRRRCLGFVFQSFQLLPSMTALENVLLPLELRGAADARREAREMLRRVGLADREEHYLAQLSGGEQQRVALARAFAPRPAVLLANEPTGNLDRGTGRQVLDGARRAGPRGRRLHARPRVFVSAAGLARTDLERFGSHVDYRTLVRFASDSPAGLAALAREREGRLDEAIWSVATHAEAQPALRSPASSA